MVADSLFKEIHSCRICSSRELRLVFDLGSQSLTGRFPAASEVDPPSAPLTLLRCAECGLVQLKHSVDTAEMFGENYGYRSGINATMRAHLAGIAAGVTERAGLKPGDVALDIGCNDGTLLCAYDVNGLVRLGIDPIAEMFRDAYPAHLDVAARFFSEQAFHEISPRAKANAITSISMFYDLEDPGAFVAAIASALAEQGIWVLEQSYLATMLARNSFDTICHEHLEYYGLRQIEGLVEAHGLRIFDVALNDINGGSFQIWVCRREASYATGERVDAMRTSEAALELETDAPYAAFVERVERTKLALRDLLAREAARGKTIYVYGASTKGNVLLQYFGLDRQVIAGCADRNPDKWGRRTPGTSLPIVSEEEARGKADCFLVLPWHFRDEFIAREAEFIKRGGKLIFPLPNLEVIG
jgi:hypothetical protein